MRSFLEDAGLLQSDRIVEPLEASEDDLLVVRNKQLSCYPLVLQLAIRAVICSVNLSPVAYPIRCTRSHT